MRFPWILVLATCASATCVPIEEASKHVGRNTCVHGKVLSVAATPGGTHLLRFCEEGRDCSFSAVVFRRDLRQVGDVRTLEGKEVDIHGEIRLYEGRPEIIVRDYHQLRGQAARLPSIPKNYDVARQGKFSPGQRPTHKQKTTKWKYPRRGAETIPEVSPDVEQ
jgi:DNA/RNA endonuclease YhcR with UshA esterase domain